MNEIVCSDNIQYMKDMPENSVDLVVTSPPYDGLRDYKGYNLDLHNVGKQIHRVLKDGGICVMVIQDSTKDFAKSLTSFRTIVDWVDTGFKLFECCIYNRQGTEGAWWTKRFRVDHEYMPIFLKGARPQYFNKEPIKIPSKHGGKTMTGANIKKKDGTTTGSRKVYINKMKCPGTVMNFGNTCGGESKLKSKHPALFPNMLAYDMIECFCPEDGLVLDPFNGSGTTTLAAKSLGRNYIGIDVSEEYCDLARQRLNTENISRKS